MVAHNYEKQGKKVLVIKPSIDTRSDNIDSRTGMSRKPDIVATPDTDILTTVISLISSPNELSCILVDEAQFLTEKQVHQLRVLTDYAPVIAYGLRTDFTLELFPGSKALFCLADSIEEVKTTCWRCNKKAIINLKHRDGNIIKHKSASESSVEIGFEDLYLPACFCCWSSRNSIHELIRL